ncbi:MAG TPA: hypothetical protein VNA30_06760 [Mycobacteriales bacterium]|nr:hypothetical protein [Mycobacteriales bacterium]
MVNEEHVPPGDGPDSRAANQAKSEPMPPSSSHVEPESAPTDPGDMSVGAGDPQAPSHDAGGER